jgi:hypothetical protein
MYLELQIQKRIPRMRKRKKKKTSAISDVLAVAAANSVRHF